MQPMESGEQQGVPNMQGSASYMPRGNAPAPESAPYPYTTGYGQPYPQNGNGGQAIPQGAFPPTQGVPLQFGVPYYGYPQPMGWQPASSPQSKVENQGQPAMAATMAAATPYPLSSNSAQQTANHPGGGVPAGADSYPPPFVEQAPYTTSSAHVMNGGAFPGQESAPSSFDYSRISTPARIAIYDSLKTAPRVIQIPGGPTHEYIEQIASITYKSAKDQGGMIPYTVVREVSENFIHAEFCEVVVSIFDQGNTIRFADQGPGIKNKELVQEPGFSSAIEPMKRYIRGVGSGLPIVKDYLETSHGRIEIEDNVNQGSVVTISLVPASEKHISPADPLVFDLTENEEAILKMLAPDSVLGVSEINKLTGIAVSSVHTALSKMEAAGLVQKVNKKRSLTTQGRQVALSL